MIDEAEHWAATVTAEINDGRYVDAIASLLTARFKSAAATLKDVTGDFEIRVGGNDEVAQSISAMLTVSQLADAELAKADPSDAVGYQRLAAATFTLRHITNVLYGLLAPVPKTSQEFAAYRAMLVVWGWITGEASAVHDLAEDGTLANAQRHVWEDAQRTEARERGNAGRVQRKDRWQTALFTFAKSYLGAKPDQSDADVVVAFRAQGGKAPSSDGPNRAVAKWRQNGDLPQRAGK